MLTAGMQSLRHLAGSGLPHGAWKHFCCRPLSTIKNCPPGKSLQITRPRGARSLISERMPSFAAASEISSIAFSTLPSNNTAIDSGEAAAQQSLSGDECSTVSVSIDGKFVDFSAVLLRDACQCPSCVHESTRQRLFSTADIPAHIQARETKIDAASESLRITWKNDVPGYTGEHNTKVDMADIRELAQSGCQVMSKDYIPRQLLWSQEALGQLDYDYDAYMKDDATLYEVVNQLRVHGLAFVKNIPALETSLATIATRIGPIKDTFYGQTWDVRTVPQAINAAYTSQDLGFHTDLLYFQHPPHVQLLHCIQSASSGGASVFADAYRAAVDLFHMDPDAFDALATVPVNYHYCHPDSNVYRTTKPVIDLRPLRVGNTAYAGVRDYLAARHEISAQSGNPRETETMLVDCMDKINWGPPFLAPFSNHGDFPQQDSDKPAISVLNSKVGKWHRAAVKFNALLQRPEYLYERKLHPGECVLFDNTRTLHSRRAFDMADVGKPRWLRGTYVDKDPYYSKLRVLQHRLDAKK